MLGDERKITDDCESKAESKSVALNLGNTDQGRRSQRTLELDETNCLVTYGLDVASCTFAARAENFAPRANAQHSRARARCFALQLREHGVEHGAVDLVAMIGVVQDKGENISFTFNLYAEARGVGHIEGLLKRHVTVYKERGPVNQAITNEEMPS